jgi:Leucine-rich repeat (LRR) protein
LNQLAPDNSDIVNQLEQLGAKLRKRKSGRLHTVDFSECSTLVTDEHLDAIYQLHKLEVLDLSGTQLSDTAILRLSEIDSLKLLTLNETPVSQETLSTLRKKMIGCRIIYLG